MSYFAVVVVQSRQGVISKINAVSTILVELVASGVLMASYLNRWQVKQKLSDQQLAAQVD